MVDQLYAGTKPAGWAKEQLAADHLPRNSGHITAGEALRVAGLTECLTAMEREHRDALDYGDGTMPDWVKHRYIPHRCIRCRCDTHAVSTCPDPLCPIVEPTPPSAFHVLLDEIRAIHDAKNKDYADSDDSLANFRECEEWGLPADSGCYTRMGDKWRRLKNLHRREFLDSGGPAVAEENIEDTAIDLANYCLIYVLLRRERRAKGAK